MKRHMKMHQADTKDKLYPCPFCGVELASKSDVRSHVAKEHEQKQKDCTVQVTTAIVKGTPEDDIQSQVDTEDPLAIEATVDQAQPKDIDGNATATDGDSGHVCNLCGKVFPLDASLQEHVRTHLSTKEHQCETCGKTFCQASSLKQHQLVHSGLKPYSCHICGVSFRKTHHLRRHFLVHTGERPYQCEFCDKTFTSSGNLNKHRAIHLGEKNFECEFCGKKFPQSANLPNPRAVPSRQQKQQRAAAAAASTDTVVNGREHLVEVASVLAKKLVSSRGRKKATVVANTSQETFELIAGPQLTDEELRQREEGRAVLHIVTPSEDDDPSHEHQQTSHTGEVSYVTISDGDIIIEI